MARQIAEIAGVTQAEDVIGPYDVIVRAVTENVDELGELVAAQIQAVEGIPRTLGCAALRIKDAPDRGGLTRRRADRPRPRRSTGLTRRLSASRRSSGHVHVVTGEHGDVVERELDQAQASMPPPGTGGPPNISRNSPPSDTAYIVVPTPAASGTNAAPGANPAPGIP